MMSSTAVISDKLGTSPSKLIADDTKQQDSFIRQETKSTTAEIRNWRTMQMIMGESNELGDIWVSLGGATNKLGWQKISENINQITNNKVKRKIVLDLRQESHLYLNDQGINLALRDNVINLGMNGQQVLEAERIWSESLSQTSSICLLTSAQFNSKNFDNGMYTSPQTIQNEKELVKEIGFEQYNRLAVTDHRGPSDEDIDAFIKLYENLQEGDWLHIHCKGGRGRSSTFAAFYLMLTMADKMSLDDIIAKLASVPPYYNLSNINNDNSELDDRNEFRKARYQQLQNFYFYAKDRLNGYSNTWSHWIAENADKLSTNSATNDVPQHEQQTLTNYRRYS